MRGCRLCHVSGMSSEARDAEVARSLGARAAGRLGVEDPRWGERLLFLVVLPLVLYLAWHYVQSIATSADFSQDFRVILRAAHDAVRWHSPYRIASSPTASRAVYPPPLFLAVAPLGALPFWLARVVWLVLLACASFGALLAVGVRDIKVYVVVGLSPLLLTALWFGNPTPVLMLLVALMWRWRDRSRLVALAIAAAASIKLWPAVMVVWLIATGRRRAAIETVVATALLLALSWAVIGFAGLRAYPSTVRTDVHDFARLNVFVVGLALAHSHSLGVATFVGILVGVLLLVLALLSGNDELAFGLSILAGLSAATIVWDHYLIILFVPIAIAAPRFSSRWLWVIALGAGTWFYAHPISIDIGWHTFNLTIPDYYVIIALTLAIAWARWDQPRSPTSHHA